MKDTSYQPIDCGFHDLLLAKATLREIIQLQYYDKGNNRATVSSIIKDVYTKNKEEFLLLESGERVRLDRIITVNDRLAPHQSASISPNCKPPEVT